MIAEARTVAKLVIPKDEAVLVYSRMNWALAGLTEDNFPFVYPISGDIAEQLSAILGSSLAAELAVGPVLLDSRGARDWPTSGLIASSSRYPEPGDYIGIDRVMDRVIAIMNASGFGQEAIPQVMIQVARKPGATWEKIYKSLGLEHTTPIVPQLYNLRGDPSELELRQLLTHTEFDFFRLLESQPLVTFDQTAAAFNGWQPKNMKRHVSAIRSKLPDGGRVFAVNRVGHALVPVPLSPGEWTRLDMPEVDQSFQIASTAIYRAAIDYINMAKVDPKAKILQPLFTPSEATTMRLLAIGMVLPFDRKNSDLKIDIVRMRQKMSQLSQELGLNMPNLGIYTLKDIGYLLAFRPEQEEALIPVLPTLEEQFILKSFGEAALEAKKPEISAIAQIACCGAEVKGDELVPFLDDAERKLFIYLLQYSGETFSANDLQRELRLSSVDYHMINLRRRLTQITVNGVRLNIPVGNYRMELVVDKNKRQPNFDPANALKTYPIMVTNQITTRR